MSPRDRLDAVDADAGERVCAFVAEHVRKLGGARWLQGRVLPPVPCTHASPEVRLFAEHRLYKVEAHVARGMVAIAEGERPVDVLTHVPRPRDVLALQARGRRCVSLLADGACTEPHKDPLAFALHDLCHLEKFVDRAHHVGQVGFFARLDEATRTGAWRLFEADLDDAWRLDFEHVACDMNGSVVFLFAALKMKLKMAVRRRHGGRAITAGPLSDEEKRAYDGALEGLLDLLAMHGPVRDAARVVSTRRDASDAALKILGYFASSVGA